MPFVCFQVLRSNHGDEYTFAELNPVKWTFDGDSPKVDSKCLSSSLIFIGCFFRICEEVHKRYHAHLQSVFNLGLVYGCEI